MIVSRGREGFFIPVFLGIFMVLTVFFLILVRISRVSNRVTMKQKILTEHQLTLDTPFADYMTLFNEDWRQNFFSEVEMPIMISNNVRNRGKNPDIYWRSRLSTTYPIGITSNTLRVGVYTRTDKTVNDPLFITSKRMDTLFTFRQDAARFDWVFPIDTDLNNFPGFLKGTNLNQTVYVHGDLTTSTTPGEIFSGFWVVDGTVTLQNPAQILGDVRCRYYHGPGGATTHPNVTLFGENPMVPSVVMEDPLTFSSGVNYWLQNASLIISTSDPVGILIDFTVPNGWREPNIIMGGVTTPYRLSEDQNVIVSTGGTNVTIRGGPPALPAQTPIGYPLVIVALANGAGIGGDVTVEGSFPKYRNSNSGVDSDGPFGYIIPAVRDANYSLNQWAQV